MATTMKAVIELTVPGIPVSQGSKNLVYNKKLRRTIVVETRQAELNGYRERVAFVAARLGRPLLDVPLVSEVEFVLRRPKRPKFDEPAVPPDLDKFMRAINDALSLAGVWQDDSRVVRSSERKRYSTGPEDPPRTIIKISRFERPNHEAPTS